MSIEPPTKKRKTDYVEKYYDETYHRHYFFDPYSGASMWEAPEGAMVADMTINSTAVSTKAQDKVEN